MAKIIAVMMVRNRQNILATTVGHLLNAIGVDQLVIADNGSTDFTRKILERIALTDRRVRWTDASGHWSPSQVLTGLAREAHQAGFGWVIPIDSDEFPWLGSSDIKTLCSSTKVGAFIFEVRNFVQWTFVRKNHPRAIETMVFSSIPIDDIYSARRLVEAEEIAFVQMLYPPKLILRTSSSLTIHRGHHTADGVDGEWEKATRMEMLHAPIPAADELQARVKAATRLEQAEPLPDIGWHFRRLLKIQEDNRLNEEWGANSTRIGLVGPLHRQCWLQFDTRLRQIALKQRSFVKHAFAGIGASLR